MTYAKKIAPLDDFLDFSSRLSAFSLLTETEFFDDSTVALNVFCLQIIQHAAAFSNQCGQCTLCTEILTIVFKVLGEVVDTEGEECDLALSRTGVFSVIAVLSEQLGFFL